MAEFIVKHMEADVERQADYICRQFGFYVVGYQAVKGMNSTCLA